MAPAAPGHRTDEWQLPSCRIVPVGIPLPRTSPSFPGPLLSRLSTKGRLLSTSVTKERLLSRYATKGRLLSTSATKGPFQRPSWKICLASASSWKVCLATSPYVDSPLCNVPLGGQPALQRPPRWTSLLSNCQRPPPVQADTAPDNGKGAERTCRPAPSEPGLEVYGGVRLTGGSRGRRR